MTTFRQILLRKASVPTGLRLVFAAILAVALVLSLNTAQPLNITFEHDAGIASLQHQTAHETHDANHAAADLDQDKDGTSGAVHMHCGCHATYAFNGVQAQPEAPVVIGRRFAFAAPRLASRDPPPLPEPPRA